MMPIVFEPQAWEDYLYWFEQDRALLKRLNRIIRETATTPFEGIGKPEPLRGGLSGFWSRRLDDQHRMVYSVKEGRLHILQCRFHYSK